MKYANLSEVAAAADVPYCRGIDSSGHYCGDPRTAATDHRRGYVEGGTVHLSDRRLSRALLRRFCLLAADVLEGDVYDQMPPWEATFRRCVLAERIARLRLHVRIPATLWTEDRWTVKAQLTEVPTSNPARREAMRWANAGT